MLDYMVRLSFLFKINNIHSTVYTIRINLQMRQIIFMMYVKFVIYSNFHLLIFKFEWID